MHYFLLILGFIFLVKGADVFVNGSVDTAKRFHIPPFIIGLTIVAMGTSAPEAAVSITAALAGQNDIATGNVIGSNIFNILIVLGLCAVIKPCNIEPIILKRDFPISFLAALAMLAMSVDTFWTKSALNQYSRIDGIILLLLFVIYMIIITLPEAKRNMAVCHSKDPQSSPLLPAIFKIIIGLAGVILGGKIVVNSAISIAESIGVSSNLIGLTVVAIGTSLPELITSVVAALKGESGLAIGNVLGSNIFNIFFVLGASAVIHPITINVVSILDLYILLIVTIITMIFFWSGRRLNRIEAVSLISLYSAYMAFLIIR